MRRRSIYCPVKTVTQPPSPFFTQQSGAAFDPNGTAQGNPRMCGGFSAPAAANKVPRDRAKTAPMRRCGARKRRQNSETDLVFPHVSEKRVLFGNKKGTAAAVPFLYCPPLTRRAQSLYARILPLAFSSGANTPPTTERLMKCTMSPRSA